MHKLKGPAIIASNHPNSMLDAVIIACQCSQQVHFTIRSDMFNNPVFHFLLRFLNAVPIYRVSEEKHKIRENFTVINKCTEILKKDGIIIVFSEGITIHEWKLKPLKSGTSKIVQHALSDEAIRNKLQVVPVGLTYSDYSHLGKTLIFQTGEAFFPGRLTQGNINGAWKQEFNSLLHQKLQPLIPELDTSRTAAVNIWQTLLSNTRRGNKSCDFQDHIQRQSQTISSSAFVTPLRYQLKRFFLPVHHSDFYKTCAAMLIWVIPAIAGLLLNGLFYFPVDAFVRKKTRNTIFFDSMFFGLMVALYPIYIIVLSIFLAQFIALSWSLWLLIIPLTGWCSLQLWISLVKINNYLILNKTERVYLQGIISGVDER